MTLIDVIVGSALVLIIFVSLLGILRASILVSSLAKARAGASSLAGSQMEYLRGLSYDALGTIGGIPAGNIPQNKTIVLDGVTYTVRTYIQYIDDPADGLGADDTNGITTDYKLAKIVVSYVSAGATREVTLLSNFSPVGIETTNGGGTLLIHVVNFSGTVLAGATVRIVNASTTPAIDLSTFSDTSGEVLLGGAPTSTEYQVYVSKDDYSSAQTYVRDSFNQNPNPGYLTVVKDETTAYTFPIDLLSSLTLLTYSPPASAEFSDTFADESLLSATSSMDAVLGDLELVDGALLGYATSTNIAPSNLYSWTSLSADTGISSGSGMRVRVYDSSGALLPDTVLSGNSEGFSSFPVSLSNVATSTYSTLVLGVIATTSNSSIVPKLFDWTVSYKTAPTPLADAGFTLTGTKEIGTTGAGAPIYKTVISTTTDALGVREMSLEGDKYSIVFGGYDVLDACATPPYFMGPGDFRTNSFILGDKTTNQLLVTVTDASNFPVQDASVSLSETAKGYSKTVDTSLCGTAYFGNLATSTDYSVDISKTGYTTTTFSNVEVDGQVFYVASFP